MEHFGAAWKLVWDNVVAWVVLVLLALGAGVVTCTVFFFFAAPNLPLLAKRAVERGGAPELTDLLVLHGWVSRALQLLVIALALAVANVIPVLGPLLVASALFYAPALLAEGHFGVFGALSGSWNGVRDRFVAILVLNALLWVAWTVSVAFCGVPALVVGPWVLLVGWLDYADHRDTLLASSAAVGLSPRS